MKSMEIEQFEIKSSFFRPNQTVTEFPRPLLALVGPTCGTFHYVLHNPFWQCATEGQLG